LLARKLDPKSPNVAEGLARAYGDMGRFHLAAHYAQELVRLLPDAPVGYILSTTYVSRIGKKKDSSRAMEKALSFPAHPVTYCEVGKGLGNFGNYQDAIFLFDKGLQMVPDHFECLMAKANLLATCPEAKFRDGAQALKLASKAYEDKNIKDWQKWEPAMVLAEAHAEAGNFKEAIRFANEALERAGPDFGRREEFREKLSLFEKKMPYRSKTVKPTD
jgi:tetratricopeptide (TPR) repeat protein